MSQIRSVSSAPSAVVSVNGSSSSPAAARASAQAPRGALDRVEVSPTARLLAKLSELPEVREDLVERVQAQIAAGTYESDARYEQAIDNLLEDIA